MFDDEELCDNWESNNDKQCNINMKIVSQNVVSDEIDVWVDGNTTAVMWNSKQ